MNAGTPLERNNYVLATTESLSSEDKARFAYFGTNAKILPPLRILNPQNIVIGDRVSIREGCNINAFKDLSFFRDYVDLRFREDFKPEDYQYDSRITIDHTSQLGRFAFLSCTRSIVIEPFVLVSERVFIGDNNHGFRHPHVPILQQPNEEGDPVAIGTGTWIGVGAAILAGAKLGRNTVVGANSVVRAGEYPSYAVIASPSAEVVFRRHDDGK